MQVRTALPAPAATHAKTFIAMFAADPWRWNGTTISQSAKAAIRFHLRVGKQSLLKRATNDKLADGLLVYSFPDGSRAGIMKKEKLVFIIDNKGNRLP